MISISFLPMDKSFIKGERVTNGGIVVVNGVGVVVFVIVVVVVVIDFRNVLTFIF